MKGRYQYANTPHLLGMHYPAACFVLTLTKQAAIILRHMLFGAFHTVFKTSFPLIFISKRLK